jgi:hypothetical protein
MSYTSHTRILIGASPLLYHHMVGHKIYMNVPYKKRHEASGVCMWDSERKTWYMPIDSNATYLSLEQMRCLREYPACLDVDYDEKDDAKNLGAVWVPRMRRWVGNLFDFTGSQFISGWQESLLLSSFARHGRPNLRQPAARERTRAEFDSSELTPECEYCGERLVVIGDRRKGGARHRDWDSRTMHKKCWKEYSNGPNWVPPEFRGLP